MTKTGWVPSAPMDGLIRIGTVTAARTERAQRAPIPIPNEAEILLDESV